MRYAVVSDNFFPFLPLKRVFLTHFPLQDELEAELEELEGAELEEQLLQPATTAPAAPVRVPAGRQPAKKVEDEDDELAELQREMAL